MGVFEKNLPKESDSIGIALERWFLLFWHEMRLTDYHHCYLVRCTGQSSADNDPRLRFKDAFQNHNAKLSHKGSCCLHKWKPLILEASLQWQPASSAFPAIL